MSAARYRHFHLPSLFFVGQGQDVVAGPAAERNLDWADACRGLLMEAGRHCGLYQ
jgi:hypothetical protein